MDFICKIREGSHQRILEQQRTKFERLNNKQNNIRKERKLSFKHQQQRWPPKGGPAKPKSGSFIYPAPHSLGSEMPVVPWGKFCSGIKYLIPFRVHHSYRKNVPKWKLKEVEGLRLDMNRIFKSSHPLKSNISKAEYRAMQHLKRNKTR